ncbi:proline--tRNA ligase [Anaerococcus sp. AGMB00486]|uniref:Proline--tRNA ligase n=1 Tax=Anaerococcus faecalis TaxID=2742993 RepID=A0ABX2NB86_9FIRM|nr:proline--tRNA ligase [Anaerococcus faecalis]NVF11959.1 proline--tRNA ligase [Anaerococcus faecalis]
MRLSNYYMPTLRDDPQDAETQSHKLLVRGAFIRKSSSGVYSYLPLGMKVINKIESIVRKSMEKYDSIEVTTSVLQSRDIWEKSGRWQNFGPEMFKLIDRHDREYCLGPTAEEQFTTLVKDELNSYKQLPLNLFQIVSKFRDEKRPRFGINRSRDFIMKDAYSFDKDMQGLEKSYQKMWDAYVDVFDQLDLDYKIVEGDSGAMGGNKSHEFMALAETGEGEIFYTENSDYAATDESAKFFLEIDENEELKEIELVETKDAKTIEEVSNFLSVNKEKCAKAVDLLVRGEPVLVIVPGDRELNMAKLIAYLQVPEHEIEMMDDITIKKITEAEPGFTGPKDLKENVRVIIDRSITRYKNLVIGANKTDHHFINANYKRDFDGEIAEDLLTAKEGDLSLDSKEKLKKARGIEVGNIFQLGTKYSESLEAYFLDENGKQKPFSMGSYGIGITRSISAIIEQHYDEYGIIWPTKVAPFHVWITLVNNNNEEQRNLAEKIYQNLLNEGIEVMLDDRKERAGVKFNDRDLVGVPYRITVGKDSKDDIVEYSKRSDMKNKKISSKEAISEIIEAVREDLCK